MARNILEIVIMNELNNYGLTTPLEASGLCGPLSCDISHSLEKMGIKTKFIDTIYLGSRWQHCFLICEYNREYYLIDPTFIGIDFPSEDKVKYGVSKTPGEILNSTALGKGLLNSLYIRGYHKLDEEVFSIYLNIFPKRGSFEGLNNHSILDILCMEDGLPGTLQGLNKSIK